MTFPNLHITLLLYDRCTDLHFGYSGINRVKIGHSFESVSDIELFLYCHTEDNPEKTNISMDELYCGIENNPIYEGVKIDDIYYFLTRFDFDVSFDSSNDNLGNSGIIHSIVCNIEQKMRYDNFPSNGIYIDLNEQKTALIDKWRIIYDIYQDQIGLYFVYYIKINGAIMMFNITKIQLDNIQTVQRLTKIMEGKIYATDVYPGGNTNYFMVDKYFAKYCGQKNTPAFLSVYYNDEKEDSVALFNNATIKRMEEFYELKKTEIND